MKKTRNITQDEAVECTELVGAKYNIPYHNSTTNTGNMFSMELAEQFGALNRLIVVPGEEIKIE